MSKLLISQYYNELEKIIKYGGSKNETSIRSAFQNLLNSYCQTRNFLLIPELPYKNQRITPDGTIKDALSLDWGYWESKDENDNLDVEIEKKFGLGYPNDNILFEDSHTAILIQAGREKMRISMKDIDALDKILKEFIEFQRPEVEEFYQAISKFKDDLPTIINTLRDLINKQVGWATSPKNDHVTSPQNKVAHHQKEGRCAFSKNENLTINNKEETAHPTNQIFQTKLIEFLNLCKDSINPNITVEDIREMMIQHILTEDIFLTIFDEASFHRDNNIASQLTDLINSFLKGAERKNLLSSIQSYYKAIKTKASQINNHHEKQKFLKIIYENFYKAYNPLVADRLGMVYTPNEIVRFMIESTDYLLHKHFNKLLGDRNVEILDPATGTGTFITEIIEYLPVETQNFASLVETQNFASLRYKYQNEIHCNEVSILPYYIANLNIEYTYQQKTGEYVEFKNICFVDTLDHTSFEGKQMDLFAMSLENTARIKRQNDKKISVIIGNPPYNAKQENFNQNNANRGYDSIDQRIKATYIKEGKAQNQIVLYDMYTRFYRWASDRLSNNGIIAFITNNSFIDGLTFDGFRKVLSEEFSQIYLVDLGGNVRQNPKISGTTHNVFGIQAGVTISFLVKTENKNNLPCQVCYIRRPEFETAKEKLDFIAKNKLQKLDFTHINPDKKYNWLNQSDNNFDDLLPLIDKDVKSGNSKEAIFKLFSRGLVTQRDEWIYDFDQDNLTEKIRFLINIYQQTLKDDNFEDRNKIKWDAELTSYLKRNIVKEFNDKQVLLSLYRPFTKQYLYLDKHFNGRTYQWFNIYHKDETNLIIAFSGLAHSKPFSVLSLNTICDLGFIETCQCLPLYSYDKEGKRQENITDWALEKFREYYQVAQAFSLCKSHKKHKQDACDTISKEDIFYYVYAVLHNPKYRETYELNLKRDFPRIPFYDNFFMWVNWGKKLMKLHLNYETIKPYKLKIINVDPPPPPFKRGEKLDNIFPIPPLLKGGLGGEPKPKLKADKIKHQIILDDVTTLTGIPPEVWEYKLGNRSALEWILDQYKEKKPKDPTIAEKFNNYHFADYKETVIDLLMRVTTVSVETMKIIKEMTHSNTDLTA